MAEISVVIPTCNRPEALLEAIKSVLDQSLPAMEIIVVNNGSQKLYNDIPFPGIKIIEIEPFAGVSTARNQGAWAACGEYIAFLDDDDLWEVDYLKKVSGIIGKDYPDCLITREDKLENGELHPYKNADGRIILSNLLVTNPGITGSTTIVNRQSFLDISGYDEELKVSEDKALILDFLIKGYDVVTAPNVQAIMRAHEGARLRNEGQPESIQHFLDKYGSYMNFRQKNFLLARYCYLDNMINRKNSAYVLFWVRFLLHKVFCKVDSTLPDLPRLPIKGYFRLTR